MKKEKQKPNGFTQACVITVVDNDLFDKLDQLGYQRTSCVFDDEHFLWIKDGFFGTEDEFDETPYKCRQNTFIGNERDMFLAIAALRDDSDYMQFFTTQDKKDWTLCLQTKFINDNTNKEYHKATVVELMEKFAPNQVEE